MPYFDPEFLSILINGALQQQSVSNPLIDQFSLAAKPQNNFSLAAQAGPIHPFALQTASGGKKKTNWGDMIKGIGSALAAVAMAMKERESYPPAAATGARSETQIQSPYIQRAGIFQSILGGRR